MHVILDVRTATDHFPGIGRYVTNLSRALAGLRAEAGLDLSLLADPSASSTRQSLPDLPIAPCAVSPFSLAQQWRVPASLRGLDATLYHSPYYLMPYRPGVPCVVTCYDVIPLVCPADYSPMQRLVFRIAHLAALRTAQAVLAISEATRADLVRWFGADPAAITVTPLAADPAFRPPTPGEVAELRQKFGLPGEYVLYFGSNKPHKNLPRLVTAWAEAQTQISASTVAGSQREGMARPTERPLLVIAGHWDPRFPDARRAVESGAAGSAVRFLGPIPEADLPALYGGAGLFVFPSLYEGFGLPVLEAMACGTPVICSNRSSLPEVAGDAALLVDPLNVARLAAALTRGLSDPVLRADLRRRGLARAAQFSWDRTARETVAVYQTVGRASFR